MKYLCSLATLIAFAAISLAQPGVGGFELPGGSKAKKFTDLAEAKAEFIPAKARPGEVVSLKLTITPKKDAWTYPFYPPAGQDGKNGFTPDPKSPLIFAGNPKDPEGWTEKDGALPGTKDRVYKKAATWEIPVVISPEAKPQSGTISLSQFSLQACNQDNCFPYRGLSATLEITGEKVAVPPQYASLVQEHLGPKTAPTPAPAEPKKTTESEASTKKQYKPAEVYQAEIDAIKSQLDKPKLDTKEVKSPWLLYVTAAFWGLISLATPCVFPMIPITVSLFLKQGHQSTTGAIKYAGIYCLTIIIVLGSAAGLLLPFFRELSINPYMNIGIGLLFVVFALSLFGMYDITLPNFLLRYAEGKRKQGGLIGTIFGAIAFSIVSFTCVAPFLGGFAALVASGQYSTIVLVVAALSFATAFAGPFFFLALFPSLLKQLPKSGGWLDSVKAVMGFLELAAALKFLRTAELRLTDRTEIFTYDVVLAGWVVIALGCGLYLLNLYRLPHDEEKPNIGVPRLIFAVLFLGLSVYLLPGMFKTGQGESQRPRGVVFAWVDAFLLPEPGGEAAWSGDLPAAVQQASEAAKDGKPRHIFIDFTGVTCTNCRANEFSVFPKPAVQEQFKKFFARVQMYTDDVPASQYMNPPGLSERKAEADINLRFQRDFLSSEQLPLYVIFEVKQGKVSIHSVYDEGKINNESAFLAFLSAPFGKGN